MTLNFDTGTSDIVLKEDVLKSKMKSTTKLYESIKMKLGERTYAHKLYPTKRSGNETDGRFGWNLFDGMIIELNYDSNIMVIHSKIPSRIIEDKEYSKLPIKYYNNVFLIESSITQNNITIKDWFLFDTGYQKTVMLDNSLLEINNFPDNEMPIINKVIMKNGMGNEIPVFTKTLDILNLGGFKLNKVLI